MNISIEREQGTGKTLLMVTKGLNRIKENPHKELYSNIELKNLSKFAEAYGYDDFDYVFLDDPSQLIDLNDAVILGDEFSLWASSLIPTQELMNKICINLAKNTRKERVDLYMTDHFAGNYNKRIREVLDYRVAPSYNEFTGQLKYDVFKFSFLRHGDPLQHPRTLGDYVKTVTYYAPPYFQFYNTQEKVKRPSYNKKDLLEQMI